MARLKYHNGSTWVPVPDGSMMKYRSGSSWVRPKSIKYHNGSTWVEAWVDDNVGPTGGGIVFAGWSQSLPGFSISYASTSDPSGISSYTLQYKDGSIWRSANQYNSSNTTNLSTSGGTANFYVSTSDRGSSPTTFTFRTVAYDTIGNPTVSGEYSIKAKPSGVIIVSAASGDTWETGSTPAWRSPTIMRAGWISSTFNYQYAYMFYGSNVVRNATHGYTPDNAYVRVSNNTGSGCANTIAVSTHNYATRPSTPNLSTAYTFTHPGIGAGGVADIELSSSATRAMVRSLRLALRQRIEHSTTLAM